MSQFHRSTGKKALLTTYFGYSLQEICQAVFHECHADLYFYLIDFSTPGNVTTTQVGPQTPAQGNAAAAAAGGILAGWGAAGVQSPAGSDPSTGKVTTAAVAVLPRQSK